MKKENIPLFKIDYDAFKRFYLIGAVKVLSNDRTAFYNRVYPPNKHIICFYHLTVCLN